MAQWSGWEVQKSVFTALDGDATLSAMVNGIYDAPPKHSAFPYIVLGTQRQSDWSAQQAAGMQVRMEIHAYTREQGHQSLADILSRMQALLHEAALSVAGQVLVNLRVLDSSMFTDPDGMTRHGVMQVQAKTQAV